MALKNQPQESASTPEQTAAANAAANTTDTTNTATDAATPAPASEEPVVTQDADATRSVTEEPQAPATEESAAPTAPIVEEGNTDSQTTLVLLGSRKGFPNTAAGNLSVATDVVLDLLQTGVLVVNSEDGESFVYLDSSKL